MKLTLEARIQLVCEALIRQKELACSCQDNPTVLSGTNPGMPIRLQREQRRVLQMTGFYVSGTLAT